MESMAVTRDFPTPPFPLTIPITLFIVFNSLVASKKLFGFFSHPSQDSLLQVLSEQALVFSGMISTPN
jgi:hypothetical protein